MGASKKQHNKYHEIKIPPNKLPKDYTYNQRRAHLLQIILQHGYIPFKRTDLAKEYGVSPATITVDVDILTPYIIEHYWKKDKVISQAITAKQKALKGALSESDWKTAASIADGILKTAFELGLIEKEPEKLEVKSSILEDMRTYYKEALNEKD